MFLIQRDAGDSPGRHLLRRRMERATRLLSHCHLSHREIAELCGFSDEFHFSKQFKQWMGKSPLAYRKANR